MDKSRQYIDKRHKRPTIDNTHASFSSPQNPNAVGIRISNYPKPRQKTSIYFLHQSTTQEEIEPFEDQDEPLELDEAARIPDALTRSHAGNDSFSQTVLKHTNLGYFFGIYSVFLPQPSRMFQHKSKVCQNFSLLR